MPRKPQDGDLSPGKEWRWDGDGWRPHQEPSQEPPAAHERPSTGANGTSGLGCAAVILLVLLAPALVTIVALSVANRNDTPPTEPQPSARDRMKEACGLALAGVDAFASSVSHGGPLETASDSRRSASFSARAGIFLARGDADVEGTPEALAALREYEELTRTMSLFDSPMSHVDDVDEISRALDYGLEIQDRCRALDEAG